MQCVEVVVVVHELNRNKRWVTLVDLDMTNKLFVVGRMLDDHVVVGPLLALEKEHNR